MAAQAWNLGDSIGRKASELAQNPFVKALLPEIAKKTGVQFLETLAEWNLVGDYDALIIAWFNAFQVLVREAALNRYFGYLLTRARDFNILLATDPYSSLERHLTTNTQEYDRAVAYLRAQSVPGTFMELHNPQVTIFDTATGRNVSQASYNQIVMSGQIPNLDLAMFDRHLVNNLADGIQVIRPFVASVTFGFAVSILSPKIENLMVVTAANWSIERNDIYYRFTVPRSPPLLAPSLTEIWFKRVAGEKDVSYVPNRPPELDKLIVLDYTIPEIRQVSNGDIVFDIKTANQSRQKVRMFTGVENVFYRSDEQEINLSATGTVEQLLQKALGFYLAGKDDAVELNSLQFRQEQNALIIASAKRTWKAYLVRKSVQLTLLGITSMQLLAFYAQPVETSIRGKITAKIGTSAPPDTPADIAWVYANIFMSPGGEQGEFDYGVSSARETLITNLTLDHLEFLTVTIWLGFSVGLELSVPFRVWASRGLQRMDHFDAALGIPGIVALMSFTLFSMANASTILVSATALTVLMGLLHRFIAWVSSPAYVIPRGSRRAR